MNEPTSSLQCECNQRLDNLYRQSHVWLLQVSYNICKSRLESEDLVGELYQYIAEKCNPKLFYDNSYNLMYCMSFIKSRWINRIKRAKKMQYQPVILAMSEMVAFFVSLNAASEGFKPTF